MVLPRKIHGRPAIQVDLITSSAILNALELRGRDDVLSLLRALRKRALRLDAAAYNAAMKGCDWRTAETLLREMQQDLVAEGGGKLMNSVLFGYPWWFIKKCGESNLSQQKFVPSGVDSDPSGFQVPWPAPAPPPTTPSWPAANARPPGCGPPISSTRPGPPGWRQMPSTRRWWRTTPRWVPAGRAVYGAWHWDCWPRCWETWEWKKRVARIWMNLGDVVGEF